VFSFVLWECFLGGDNYMPLVANPKVFDVFWFLMRQGVGWQ